MDRVILTWKNKNDDLEVHQQIKKFFEINHLECKETEDGLYITCNDKKNAFSYMWLCMIELANHLWSRKVVKSCVWTDGFESEDVIVSSRELIAKGEMDLYE